MSRLYFKKQVSDRLPGASQCVRGQLLKRQSPAGVKVRRAKKSPRWFTYTIPLESKIITTVREQDWKELDRQVMSRAREKLEKWTLKENQPNPLTQSSTGSPATGNGGTSSTGPCTEAPPSS